MTTLQQLADDYVTLSNEIKIDSGILADRRKELKKLDATLLVEMAKNNVNEIASEGVVLTRSSKLSAK
jgi:hypothetical protein